MSRPEPDPPLLGLRERKRAKTLAAIQTAALRLFREQGYDETTVEQIADVAEVSPSTFFRYFPTKEDVVLLDLNDPLVIDAFKAQPPELSVVAALRNAIESVVEKMTPEQIEIDRERQALVLANLELRARMWDEIAKMIDLMTGLVAERTGRSPDDFELRVFAGAAMGVAFSLLLSRPGASMQEMMLTFNDGLERLAKGITF